jgi:hypothetical protein
VVLYNSSDSEFVDPSSLYSKGYDNSGANDEEVPSDEEYSDDEAEAEAKSKRKQQRQAEAAQAAGAAAATAKPSPKGGSGLKGGFFGGAAKASGGRGRGAGGAGECTSH